jgi:hypothetical protein
MVVQVPLNKPELFDSLTEIFEVYILVFFVERNAAAAVVGGPIGTGFELAFVLLVSTDRVVVCIFANVVFGEDSRVFAFREFTY